MRTARRIGRQVGNMASGSDAYEAGRQVGNMASYEYNVNDYRLRVRASSIARRMSAISWFASLVDRASLTGASSGSFPATLAKRMYFYDAGVPAHCGLLRRGQMEWRLA